MRIHSGVIAANDAPGTIQTITTDASATPTTAHLILSGAQNALRFWTDEQAVTEEYFYLYVSVNGGTTKKVRVYRWQGRVMNVTPHAVVSFGTSNGRSLKVAAMTVPSSLPTPSGVSGTANCDTAGPPLWSPSAAHVTLASYNQTINLAATDATERVVFLCEYDGSAWSPARWYWLPATGSINVLCTYKQIALANYDGVAVTVTAPTGTTIGGTSASMSLSMSVTGTTRTVTAGDESDFRAKLAAAVAGDEVVLPAGTYTLTANISNSTFTANVAAGNIGAEGIIIRGATGNRADVIITPNTNASGWVLSNASGNKYIMIKDVTFDVTGTGTGITFNTAIRVRCQNVRFTGLNGSSDVVNITGQTSVATFVDFLNCQADTSSVDCWNLNGAGAFASGSTGMRFVNCVGYGAGAFDSAQCFTSHNANPAEIYGGNFYDAQLNAIANDGFTTPTYLFFMKSTGGSRKNTITSITSAFACALDGPGGSTGLLAASSYSLFNRMTNSAGTITRITSSSPIFPTIRHNRYLGSGSRGWHPSIGGQTCEHNIFVGAFTSGEAIRVADYGSGNTDAISIVGNTFYSLTTANNLATTNMSITFNSNVTHTTTTSINTTAAQNALMTKDYNVLDPTVDADYSAGANDSNGANAAINTTSFLPTASGNCDRTGDGSLMDWCGDCDPFGWVLIYKQGEPSRGARGLPGVYSGAELFPDVWA